jgi:hypothetical protein|nr:MAG TPA: hypothetical protein [Caudoviricetes sp.]
MGLFDKFVKVDTVDFGDEFTNAVYLKGKYDGIDQEQLNSAYISVLSAGIMALSYAVIRRATNKRNKEINERLLNSECIHGVLADVEGERLDYSSECVLDELLKDDK